MRLIIAHLRAMATSLDRKLTFYVSNALASSTKAAYRRHLNSYVQFCTSLGLMAWPASELTIARYVTHLSATSGLQSIRCHLAAIRLAHLMGDHSPAAMTSPLVHYTLLGLSKVQHRAPRRMTAMTPALLRSFIGHLDLNQAADTLFWGAALLMMYTLLRKSHILATSTPSHDTNLLRRADVRFDKKGMTMTITRSKTRNASMPPKVIRLQAQKGRVLCPVGALRLALGVMASAGEGSALLAWPDGRPYLYHQFLKLLRQLLTIVGADPDKYGAHSFRRGGATLAADMGASVEQLKALGDWRSDAYQAYINPDTDLHKLSTKMVRR